MTSSRLVPSFAAPLALFLATGCNFIFNPANSDDVIRCKNTTECEKEEIFFDALNTERLDAACASPAGGGGSFTSSKTNQVCSVVDKASVSCATEMLPASDFADAVEAADANKIVYAACTGPDNGTLGCPPKTDGNCVAPLEPNEYGVCDDGDGLPLFPRSDLLLLQDVKDQHCRSYFCDDSFVCNNKTSKCVRCDPDLKVDGVGQGACGELALKGARSTVYQPNATLTKECPDVSKFEATKFGPVVVADEP
jgi:hypothetical protein